MLQHSDEYYRGVPWNVTWPSRIHNAGTCAPRRVFLLEVSFFLKAYWVSLCPSFEKALHEYRELDDEIEALFFLGKHLSLNLGPVLSSFLQSSRLSELSSSAGTWVRHESQPHGSICTSTFSKEKGVVFMRFDKSKPVSSSVSSSIHPPAATMPAWIFSTLSNKIDIEKSDSAKVKVLTSLEACTGLLNFVDKQKNSYDLSNVVYNSVWFLLSERHCQVTCQSCLISSTSHCKQLLLFCHRGLL